MFLHRLLFQRLPLASRSYQRLFLLAFPLATTLGCGGEETTVVEVIPTVSITGVISSKQTVPNEPAALESPAAIELGCDGLLAFRVATQEFTLTAPGSCGAATRCGHVRMELQKQDAEPIVFAGLGLSPIAVPEEHRQNLDALTGRLEVLAELVWSNGSPYLTNAGEPVASRLELDVIAPECSDEEPSGD